jgi:hypothetical protein
MAVIACPVCGFGVNARATRCAECGADPTLSPGEARADLLARGLALPAPYERRVWSRRRRLTTAVVALLAAIILLAPLWLGYFGAETAVWARVWRPWRTQVSVELVTSPATAPSEATFTVEYRDPWPGEGSSPGWQLRYCTVQRPLPLLPWVVTDTSSGI